MAKTDGLGNDPKWGEALRKLSAEVIAAAPPEANAARCTISGADRDFECLLEFSTGAENPSEKLQYAAADLVGVWFEHNSGFHGLELGMAKEADGDWQIVIEALPPAPTANQDHGQEPEEPNSSNKSQNQQRRISRTSTTLEEKRTPPWVKTALISVAAIIVVGGIGGGAFYLISQIKPPPKPVPILEARKGFETNLTKRIEAPQEFDENAPEGVKVIEYESGDRKLTGWLVLPDREPPFPAIVYAHDGFALNRGDYDNVKPFVDRGFAVLLPSFRGENGNPGDFEMCYGEVDDLVNAIEYMASRKKVDPKSIFGVGFGVGATNVMLAAELSSNLRKVAVCGGRPDMAADGTAYENAPFQRTENELIMRSPGRFHADLKSPMLLLYAENEPAHKLFQEQAKTMEKDCKTEPILVEALPGVTHDTAIAPAISRMIKFFDAR